MKILRNTALLSMAGLFLVASAADTFTIRRVFVKGETDTYDMASNSDNTIDLSAFGQGSMPMKMEMSGKVGYTTKSIDEKGVATVEIKFSKMEMTMDGPMPGGDMPKEYSMTAKVDSQNRYKDVKVEGLPVMMRMTSEQSIKSMFAGFEFPEGAVKVGDTWEIKIPKDGKTFSKDQVAKAKLAGSKVVDGKTILDIEVEGDLEIEIDASKLGDGGNAPEGMPANMMVKGKVRNKSVVRVDAATGKMVYMEADSNSDMAVEMDMGKIPMSGTTKVIIKKAKS